MQLVWLLVRSDLDNKAIIDQVKTNKDIEVIDAIDFNTDKIIKLK